MRPDVRSVCWCQPIVRQLRLLTTSTWKHPMVTVPGSYCAQPIRLHCPRKISARCECENVPAAVGCLPVRLKHVEKRHELQRSAEAAL